MKIGIEFSSLPGGNCDLKVSKDRVLTCLRRHRDRYALLYANQIQNNQKEWFDALMELETEIATDPTESTLDLLEEYDLPTKPYNFKKDYDWAIEMIQATTSSSIYLSTPAIDAFIYDRWPDRNRTYKNRLHNSYLLK